MTIGVVQTKAATLAASTSTVITLTSAVTAGNALVFAFAWGPDTISAPSSINRETWTQTAVHTLASCGGDGFAYALNVVGGYTTITITFPSAIAGGSAFIWELSGVLAFDQSNINNGNSTTATVNPITPATTAEAFFAVVNQNALYSSGPTNGYTDDSHAVNYFAHLIAGATDSAAKSTSYTLTTTNLWITSALSLIAARGIAAPPPRLRPALLRK